MRARLPAILLGLTLCVSCSSTNALSLSDRNETGTFRVKLGGRVTVTLHNTYWAEPTSSVPTVLAPDGSARTVGPALGTGGCPQIPGTGCGTVTQTFVARTRGGSVITSSGTVCGEALACSPPQRFTVAIEVE